MSSFVPPYPARPKKALSPLATLRAGRRNLIAIFEDQCFDYQFFSSRLINRQLFVCNSPDTVAQAFITLHDSFERKTPVVRHALAPLIGADASFISDGRIWKQRRRIVAPIVHVSHLPLFAPIMVEAAAD